MHSLFWKIFLTMWLSIVGFSAAIALLNDALARKQWAEQPQQTFERGLYRISQRAQQALMSEGRKGLRDELLNIPRMTRSHIYIVDEKESEVLGRDKALRNLVEQGLFREDLFYRLHVITIDLPPLRRRREDIPLLVEHFLGKYSAENGKKVDRISEDALQVLVDHPWPGNVRQLENAIERAVVLAPGREVSLDLLPPDLFDPRPGTLEEVALPPGMTLPEALERYERQIIEAELGRCDGVQRRAAERLGVRATTLSEKIRRLGLRS